MRMIAFAGYIGAGKTTAGMALATLKAMRREAFAAPIKAIAYQLGWNGEKDGPGRQLLREIGQAGRRYDEDCWIKRLDEKLEGYVNDVVVDDLRFLNEIDYVVRKGGMVIWIDRPGVTSDGDETESLTASLIVKRIAENKVDPSTHFAIVRNTGSVADMLRSASQAIIDAEA